MLRSGPEGESFAPSPQGFSVRNYGNDAGVANLTAVEIQRLVGKAVGADETEDLSDEE